MGEYLQCYHIPGDNAGVRRVLALPLGRFLVLLEAARRRAARERLWELQVAGFPHREGKDRQQIINSLRDQIETAEEKQERWDAGWQGLDRLLSGPQRKE